MMYWSSGAGKAGESGTAMDFAARIASRVTFRFICQFNFACKEKGGRGRHVNNKGGGGCDRLTYIIVTVFDEESDALAVDVGSSRGVVQAIPGPADVAKQLPVAEPAAAAGVYDHGRVRVMASDCLEDRQTGERERGQHPDAKNADYTNYAGADGRGAAKAAADRSRGEGHSRRNRRRQLGTKSKYPATGKGKGHWEGERAPRRGKRGGPLSDL